MAPSILTSCTEDINVDLQRYQYVFTLVVTALWAAVRGTPADPLLVLYLRVMNKQS